MIFHVNSFKRTNRSKRSNKLLSKTGSTTQNDKPNTKQPHPIHRWSPPHNSTVSNKTIMYPKYKENISSNKLKQKISNSIRPNPRTLITNNRTPGDKH